MLSRTPHTTSGDVKYNCQRSRTIDRCFMLLNYCETARRCCPLTATVTSPLPTLGAFRASRQFRDLDIPMCLNEPSIVRAERTAVSAIRRFASLVTGWRSASTSTISCQHSARSTSGGCLPPWAWVRAATSRRRQVRRFAYPSRGVGDLWQAVCGIDRAALLDLAQSVEQHRLCHVLNRHRADRNRPARRLSITALHRGDGWVTPPRSPALAFSIRNGGLGLAPCSAFVLSGSVADSRQFNIGA